MEQIDIKVHATIPLFLFFITVFRFSSGLCPGDLCFDWTASLDRLILSCKIDRPNFRVFINDPHGITQGECLPLHPNAVCESHFKNATLSLNYTTNIAMFELRGKIDPGVNGIWTCEHGTRHQQAQCNVNISKLKDRSIDYCKNNILAEKNDTLYETDCLKDILIFSFGGYLVVVIMLMLVCVYRDQLCKKEYKCLIFKTCRVLESKAFTIFRITAFVCFSCLYFILCLFASSIFEGICQSLNKWILITVGILMGVFSSVLCLTRMVKNDKDENDLSSVGELIDLNSSTLEREEAVTFVDETEA